MGIIDNFVNSTITSTTHPLGQILVVWTPGHLIIAAYNYVISQLAVVVYISAAVNHCKTGILFWDRCLQYPAVVKHVKARQF